MELMQTYKFHNLWPTELAEIAVDWSSDAIQEYTVTFAMIIGVMGSDTNVLLHPNQL